MKRFFLLSSLLLLSVLAMAQTQTGVVKTRGRMVNGQLQKGTPLAGATVQVKDRSAVVSKQDGTFAFPVPGNTFLLQSVKKQGYELVDADFFKNSYKYSANPLFIVMETPEQQQADQLEAQRKIRRTLQRQLQKREEEIEAMQVTLAEKQALLNQLYKNQENNEQLISEMAKRYAELDYDQLDDLNRRISDFILNGELVKADSLLRTKGDLTERMEELKRHQQANTQVRQDLEKSEALAQQKLNDLATDCYSRFEICKMESRFDSAAHYITMRANLDTMNIKYQVEAGHFLKYQKKLNKASTYIFRAYRIGKKDPLGDNFTYYIDALMLLAEYMSDMGKYDISAKLYKAMLNSFQKVFDNANNISEGTKKSTLADCEKDIAWQRMLNGDYEESEHYYKAALEKYTWLTNNVSEKYNTNVYRTNIGIASLYRRMKRYGESEAIYMVVLETARKKAKANPNYYEFDIARIQHGLGTLYKSTERYSESEQALQEALKIFASYAEHNPQAHNMNVANVKWSLASLYKMQDRDDESIRQYEEAYSIFSANSISIDDAAEIASIIATLYGKYGNYEESLKWSYNSFKAYLYLLKTQKDSSVEKKVATQGGNMSCYCLFLKKYSDAEQMAVDALAVDSTQHWIATNLAAALLFQGKYDEAEAVYRQYKDELKESFLADIKQFAEAGVIPKEREKDVEKIKRMLNE